VLFKGEVVMSIKVLYIDGDGPMGGASRSLFEVLSFLHSRQEISPYFFVSSGSATVFYKRIAVDSLEVRGMSKFDNTRYGYYRGMRWAILLREMVYLPFMCFGLFQARRRWRDVEFDVIHVNEFVYLLPALLAKVIFKAPLVVHVRALCRDDQGSLRVRFLNWVFSNFVDSVVAIDGNVRRTLPADVSVEIINNSFSPSASNAPAPEFVAKFKSLSKETFKAGFVGNLHLSKGVFEIVQAAKILRDQGRDIDFIMVGGITLEDKGLKAWVLSKLGFAQNFASELNELIAREDLQNCFHLMGPTLDIKYVYDHISVLLFPSHFDAPGRPVFEAGFSGIPSIVAVRNASDDTFVSNETGLAIPAKDPGALAEAIAYLQDHESERARMGGNAQLLAQKNFVPERNAAKLLDVYAELVRVSNAKFNS
tara:strand:- start:3045 stop:4313 length:1269 start_codon:yes stop_codon:yes gene_type:complete